MSASKDWWVYIIRASNDSLYTGITTDVKRRFAEHQSGKGARFFNSARHPQAIVWKESHHDRSSASIREAEIKQLTRQQKLKLIG